MKQVSKQMSKTAPIGGAYTRQLQSLRASMHALDSARTVPEIKQIRDQAEAVRTFAHNAKLGLELQNQAAEIKLRAERKAGDLLRTMRLKGGDRRSKHHHERLTLAQLGIDQNQSKRWQKQASVSEKKFHDFIRYANAHGLELTSAALLRLANQEFPTQNYSGPHRNRKDEPAQINPVEVVEELENHCQLLNRILSPLCGESKSNDLRNVEKRTVLRLLNEMRMQLAELRSQVK